MSKKTQTFEFKRGQKIHLDSIYFIQALGGGDWWKRATADELDDDLIITRNIRIEINWWDSK